MAKQEDLTIVKGSTFSFIALAEIPPIVYRDILDVQTVAPVRITTTEPHGLVDAWKVALTNIKGPVELNATPNKVTDRDRYAVTVIDPTTIEINAINAAGYKPYVNGGVLQYNTPLDLTGFTARMSIVDKLGGTELFRLDTINGRVAISISANTITLTISADDTAALEFSKGVYDLEIESPSGVVTKLMYGAVTVSKEATTT